MDSEFWSAMPAAAWILVILAFAVGIVVGRFFLPRTGGGDAAAASVRAKAAGGGASARIDALAEELETARGLLEDARAGEDAVSEELARLEQAVNRANGRLTLLRKGESQKDVG